MASKGKARKDIYVLLILLLAGIVGISFSLLIKRLPPSSASFATQETYWRARIREVGGAAAYKEFATSVQGMDLISQHGRAHIFGDALYTEVGLSGTAICNQRLGLSGCMHQFIGRAVLEYGISAVPLLVRNCKGDFPCQHGIGHGIVGILGYTFSDLEKALALCKTLPDNNSVLACEGGALMEYNLRLMLNDLNDIRPLGDDWFAPCDRLSGDDARTCYFDQPTWWAALWSRTRQIQTQESAFEPAFKHMADLCHSLSEKTFMYACTAGTGLSALLEASPDQAVHLCDRMYPDADESLFCRATVALMLREAASSSATIDTCQGLSDEAKINCMAYASG